MKMKSIILAAGEGTRLRPYTLKKPKCLVEVGGKSLIDRQLQILSSEGISEQIIIGGYLAEKLKNRGTKLLINPRFDETNMVWTLFCAEKELEGEIIVTYGDIVYSRHILKMLIESKSDIAVVIDMGWKKYWEERMENPLNDAETLKLSSKGQILEIGKNPKSFQEIEGQFIGLMKFSQKGVNQLKKIFHDEAKKSGFIQGKPIENAYMTDLLQTMIDKGYNVDSVPVNDYWVEVDTVEDLIKPTTLKRIKEIDKGI